MADKNIEKPDPSKEGQSSKDAVDKIDKEAPFSLEEAKATVNAEEGKIEEAIEKSRTEKSEKEVAPDLVELKKEQTEKKKEVKQKEKEVKEAVKVEKEKVTVSPSKFEGKTQEERLKIYLDMEKSHTKLSQEKKDLEAKVVDLATVDKKIDDLKKESVIRQEKAVQVKLPEYPKDELYYDDPVKYNRQVKEYNDAQLKASLAPFYARDWASQEDKIIKDLKDNTKDDIIPYVEVEKEVQTRLRRNPVVINQIGLGANKYFYDQIVKEKLPQKMIDLKTNAKEEAKKELAEENKENSESDVMSSDITTEQRESAQVDFAKVLDDGADPEKVISAIKKKHGITSDI